MAMAILQFVDDPWIVRDAAGPSPPILRLSVRTQRGEETSAEHRTWSACVRMHGKLDLASERARDEGEPSRWDTHSRT
jgi:hypothetical protein